MAKAKLNISLEPYLADALKEKAAELECRPSELIEVFVYENYLDSFKNIENRFLELIRIHRKDL